MEKTSGVSSPYTFRDEDGLDRPLTGVEFAMRKIDIDGKTTRTLVPFSLETATGPRGRFTGFDCEWSKQNGCLVVHETYSGPESILRGIREPVWIADGMDIPGMEAMDLLPDLPPVTVSMLEFAMAGDLDYCAVCDDHVGDGWSSKPCRHLYEDLDQGGMNGSGADPEKWDGARECLLEACRQADKGHHLLFSLMRAWEHDRAETGMDRTPHRVLFGRDTASFGMFGFHHVENFFDFIEDGDNMAAAMGKAWMGSIDPDGTPEAFAMTRQWILSDLETRRRRARRPAGK